MNRKSSRKKRPPATDPSSHARAEALFADDLPEPPGLLHAAVVPAPVAHGTLRELDTSAAAEADGVVRILTAADIPGTNQVGVIVSDEPLLADGSVHYLGQPVAVILAESRGCARRAAGLVECGIDALPATFDPREAAAAGQFISPSRSLSLGDVDSALPGCAVVVNGRADSGAQEHLYLETQASVAYPGEKGGIRIVAGTQSPTGVQKATARILDLPMTALEIDVRRLGGAFGGKEDQATHWAAIAALGAHVTGRPVKIALSRGDDMRLTGKRHPYSSDFRIGLDETGKILAYDVTLYQNSGAAADLSPAILERSLFHATNSYSIPNVRVTAYSCRTNLPPFTAFRGFGAPQAIFVIEAAIARTAEVTGRKAHEIQKRNLLREKDTFPYGMRAERCRARRAFEEACIRFDLAGLEKRADRHNRKNRLTRKGVSVMPVCFGISFTNKVLNQAGALVHVYTDGSVGVSTGAVEMGQGVNEKIAGIAARALEIGREKVLIESTNTTRVANTSPTAASSGADLNGMAVRLACEAIQKRLGDVARRVGKKDGKIGLSWEELVERAYLERVSLSAQAHWATPGLDYDREAERGAPFAYHVYGTAITEATVDCLRGTYEIDAVHVVHDAGKSLDPVIDRGQVEGGVVQGIGWATIEEVLYSGEGRLLTDSMATYKVPDLHFAPLGLDTVFLDDAANPKAVMHSKAIGEPPFMYGIGSYFAVLNAMKAFRPEGESFFSIPLTHEKVLLFLAGDLTAKNGTEETR
jgi:xanthine dehydrogenase large subunit